MAELDEAVFGVIILFVIVCAGIYAYFHVKDEDEQR